MLIPTLKTLNPRATLNPKPQPCSVAEVMANQMQRKLQEISNTPANVEVDIKAREMLRVYGLWFFWGLSRGFIRILLMDKILHDLKDPKLWELWHIPSYGSCRILSINRTNANLHNPARISCQTCSQRLPPR